MEINSVNKLLLRAKQKGMFAGSITIPIVKGILRTDKAEYVITEWEDDRKNVDSVHSVDN